MIFTSEMFCSMTLKSVIPNNYYKVLKSSQKKIVCLFSNLKGSKLINSFIYGHLIKQLITDKVFMLERICLQF